MLVVESLEEAHQVRGRRADDKHVEDLVRAAPDVELAGHPLLGHTGLDLSQ